MSIKEGEFSLWKHLGVSPTHYKHKGQSRGEHPWTTNQSSWEPALSPRRPAFLVRLQWSVLLFTGSGATLTTTTSTFKKEAPQEHCWPTDKMATEHSAHLKLSFVLGEA